MTIVLCSSFLETDGTVRDRYFYGEFLLDEGDYDLARQHLQQAQQAPARLGRELADVSRQREIAELLQRVDVKQPKNKG